MVSTLTLCTIPDDRRAIAEAHRVLRAGGRFVALEHVRSSHPVVRFIQRVLEPVFCRVAGDHLLRDPADFIEVEGFALERVERSRSGLIERLIAVKSDVGTSPADATVAPAIRD